MSDQYEDFDEFDEKNADAESRRSGAGLPRITYINSAPKYDGTSIAGGGFLASVVEGVKPPADWEEITQDGKKFFISPSLECAVISISPYTRRYTVSGVNDDGKEWFAGHVDFEQSFWKNLPQNVKAQYQDRKGIEPPYRVSLFIVLKSDPSQVWELGLKAGNASAMFGVSDQLLELAHYQTERLGKMRGKAYENDLYPFINWVTLVAGCRLQYPTRKVGDEPRAFNRISITWPGSGEVKKFQRNFVTATERGQQVDHWAEWHAAKKLLGDEDYSAMCVGIGNYGNFKEKRKKIDLMMMEGYINPLQSLTEIEEAIEECKRKYFERAIAINSRQLPPAAPADDGPRNRDEWEDAKRSLAQNPPAQAPFNGKPPKTDTNLPKPWSDAQMKEFKKAVILNWADASEQDRAKMVSSVNVQFLMRFDIPHEWKGEPDAKQVAKAIQNCIDFDEINAPEGQVSY